MAQNKEKLTLTYFDFPGRAELSRVIMAYAGVDFVDDRFKSREEFAQRKEGFPYKQVPVLTIEGYGSLCQSITVARFLANRYNLTGHNAIAKAEADEIVDALGDLATLVFPAYKATDAETKKKLLAEAMPKMEAAAGNIEARLVARGGQFMAGNTLTWADLCAYTVTGHLKHNKAEGAMAGCPHLLNLVDRVSNIPNIKKWRENHM